MLRTTKSPQESLEKAIELMQKAIALDDGHGAAHGALGMWYACNREYDKAIAEGKRAMALDPSGAEVHVRYGGFLRIAGRPEESIPMYQKGIRLNPFAPAWYYSSFVFALLYRGRFEEAVSAYKKAGQLVSDDIPTHIGLASTYSMMGREKEARAEAEEVLRINPKFSVDQMAKRGLPYKEQWQIDKIVNAWRKAGLK